MQAESRSSPLVMGDEIRRAGCADDLNDQRGPVWNKHELYTRHSSAISLWCRRTKVPRVSMAPRLSLKRNSVAVGISIAFGPWARGFSQGRMRCPRSTAYPYRRRVPLPPTTPAKHSRQSRTRALEVRRRTDLQRPRPQPGNYDLGHPSICALKSVASGSARTANFRNPAVAGRSTAADRLLLVKVDRLSLASPLLPGGAIGPRGWENQSCLTVGQHFGSPKIR